MQIYFKQLDIDQGFKFLKSAVNIIDDIYISPPRGIELFEYYYDLDIPIRCYRCKLVASYFIADQHKNNLKQPPVLNLFGHNGKQFRMMTQDHIIPKSLKGSDQLANLRPACENCNKNRGNKMTSKERKFMEENPHLLR